MRVMLNPAPFRPLDKEIIEKVNWLTPNESESELLFENEVDKALMMYPEKLIVTKGLRVHCFTVILNNLLRDIKRSS